MLTELPDLLYDVKLDTTEWPLLVLTTPGKVDDENLGDFLKDFLDYIAYKKDRYSMVMDVSQTSGMTPKQRKILNSSIGNENTNKYIICVALVFKSKILSRILTAILWYKKSEYPVKVFSSAEDAKDWARTQM